MILPRLAGIHPQNTFPGEGLVYLRVRQTVNAAQYSISVHLHVVIGAKILSWERGRLARQAWAQSPS